MILDFMDMICNISFNSF